MKPKKINGILEIILAGIGIMLGFLPIAKINGIPLSGIAISNQNGSFYVYYAEMLHSYYIILLSASFTLLIIGGLSFKKEIPMDVYIIINVSYLASVVFITLDVANMPVGMLKLHEAIGNSVLSAEINISKTFLWNFIFFDGIPIYAIVVAVITVLSIAFSYNDESSTL